MTLDQFVALMIAAALVLYWYDNAPKHLDS